MAKKHNNGNIYLQIYRASLCIKFLVWRLSSAGNGLCMQTMRLLLSPTLITITYNSSSSPCMNTKCGRVLPHLFKVCPWLLLIVISNAARTEKCRIFRVNGRSLSNGFIVIRGMYTITPLEVRLRFLAVMSVAHAARAVYALL